MQDVDAMYYLGICHERGLGTACNEAKAAELYRSAASHGHVSALHNLAVFFEHGIGGTVSTGNVAFYPHDTMLLQYILSSCIYMSCLVLYQN